MCHILSKILLFNFICQYLSLSDVTDKIFGHTPSGYIAAFGDFDADKHTDIFVISDKGSYVSVYLADSEKKYEYKKLMDNSTLEEHATISSVVPADFDGDLQMDLLITSTIPGKENSAVTCRIYWGDEGNLDTENYLALPKMVDQPLVFDYNADMIPDLLGEVEKGKRMIWVLSVGRNYSEEVLKVPSGLAQFAPLRIPQTSAFVDLNNDLTPDLCIVSENDSVPQLEYWINKDGVLTWNGTTLPVTFEKQLKVFGQISFQDLDGDLTVDPFLPGCLDDVCAQSVLLVYNGNKWVNLPVNYDNGAVKWSFIPSQPSGLLRLPPTLRVGDFNLDSHPDLLVVVGNGNLHRAVLMFNKECTSNCGEFSRTFEINWNTWIEGHDSRSLLPAFYDLRDNGILDIVHTSLNSEGQPVIGATEHDFVDDACFMKVTVVSGRCNYDCPGNRKPYGVNQPGPTIRYKTIDVKGKNQEKVAYQLSQSAYLPLQLPYNVFGLGQAPNFVDSLQVGIATNTTKQLNHEFQSVIPNSQLVIIPYPIQDPSKWSSKLFVMPSRLMLLTGAALLGTCGFIAGIVAILHWRDRVEDRKEKRQEAQKFHFDAM
ncbi:T-cell immunomodulatory protein-like isoform X2 [Dreissena polymorpha]|uniref:T-cell immunomodulatory protein-like isoform X2 n=1 Tax=Dreissena polymorpha TaxID=45954 RepID=UPI0022643E18|nr:T-cell immunomodulatory protein-like isoform X2 [Dreissena polymorpha]